MASGRPVVAFRRGGATETVIEGMSGIFFDEQTVEAISLAVKNLANIQINPDQIAAHAKQFGRQQFFQKMRTHIDNLVSQRANAR
jgi:glycosyltransferase involved in cell wall biosynthesis